MITFCRCFHVLVKYRVVLVWQMDKCAIFGWMEALGRSRAKSGIDCSFAPESRFDYNHRCDWLRQGSGNGMFLKTWDLNLGYEVAVILLFENWKLENGKGEKWEENKLRPLLRSGSGFSWSGFSTLSRPSRSSSASPGHLTFFLKE